MTGSRTRPAARPRWAERAAMASTAEDRMRVAYDRLRAGLAWMCRPQRDPQARADSVGTAMSIADEAAAVLSEFARQVEEARRKVTKRDRDPAA